MDPPRFLFWGMSSKMPAFPIQIIGTSKAGATLNLEEAEIFVGILFETGEYAG